jgi:peptide/nickel transport system permease protein
LAAAGLAIVGVLIVAAVAAPAIARHDPSAIDLLHPLDPPSGRHWLGTDSLGRDVWSRWIYGARISLEVGVIAVGIALLIGILVGAIAGYYGGWIDSILMRCVDVMLCIPTFFLLLAVIAFLQPGIGTIMVVIGVTGWMGIARLVRAEVLTLKEREFIQAARGLGASDARIILRHLLPNAIAPILVAGTLGIGGAILTESALSFLGLGVQPPTPSWGNMLIEAKATLGVAWWLTVYPGLAILITVLGFNLLGEGLRERWGRR